MAITITNKALQEYTDYWQDPVNKYIRLYTTKLVFDESVPVVLGEDIGTVIPILGFDITVVGTKEAIEGSDEFKVIQPSEPDRRFFYYFKESGVEKGRSVSYSGQTTSSDNEQQIGGLDLKLTWSNDDNSFVGNSTIDYDEIIDRLTIDVTP